MPKSLRIVRDNVKEYFPELQKGARERIVQAKRTFINNPDYSRFKLLQEEANKSNIRTDMFFSADKNNTNIIVTIADRKTLLHDPEGLIIFKNLFKKPQNQQNLPTMTAVEGKKSLWEIIKKDFGGKDKHPERHMAIDPTKPYAQRFSNVVSVLKEDLQKVVSDKNRI